MGVLKYLVVFLLLGTSHCLKCFDNATSAELVILSELYINCIPDPSYEAPDLEPESEEAETNSPMFMLESISRKRRFISDIYDVNNDIPHVENRDLQKSLGLHQWGCAFHCMMEQVGLMNPYDDKPDRKYIGKYISTFNDTEMRDFLFESSHKCFQFIDRTKGKCDFTLELVQCIWARLGANCE